MNIAGLTMTVGELDLARALLDQAFNAAMEAAQWRLQVDVLCAQADCAIAVGDHQHAWALFEQAESLRQSRFYLLADMGRYERLRRHYTWATMGYHAMQHLSQTAPLSRTCTQVSDYLEARYFEEWAEQREARREGCATPASKELARRGLQGVFAKLGRLGITAPSIERDPSFRNQDSGEPGDADSLRARSACSDLVEKLTDLRITE